MKLSYRPDFSAIKSYFSGPKHIKNIAQIISLSCLSIACSDISYATDCNNNSDCKNNVCYDGLCLGEENNLSPKEIVDMQALDQNVENLKLDAAVVMDQGVMSNASNFDQAVNDLSIEQNDMSLNIDQNVALDSSVDINIIDCAVADMGTMDAHINDFALDSSVELDQEVIDMQIDQSVVPDMELDLSIVDAEPVDQEIADLAIEDMQSIDMALPEPPLPINELCRNDILQRCMEELNSDLPVETCRGEEQAVLTINLGNQEGRIINNYGFNRIRVHLNEVSPECPGRSFDIHMHCTGGPIQASGCSLRMPSYIEIDSVEDIVEFRVTSDTARTIYLLTRRAGWDNFQENVCDEVNIDGQRYYRGLRLDAANDISYEACTDLDGIRYQPLPAIITSSLIQR